MTRMDITRFEDVKYKFNSSSIVVTIEIELESSMYNDYIISNLMLNNILSTYKPECNINSIADAIFNALDKLFKNEENKFTVIVISKTTNIGRKIIR